MHDFTSASAEARYLPLSGVIRAYQEFVAPGTYTFWSRDNADRLGAIVKFNWEMVPADGGEAAGAGLEILVLDEDGRIKTDYQFIEG